MTDSMAQPGHRLAALELPGWKTAFSGVAAFLLACLFVISGVWKITDAPGAAVRMMQAHVPASWSLPVAVGFGIAETVAGALILVPRFRRWGSILSSALLLAFVAYFALNYSALHGADCSCFPWVKRVVGPAFFVGDGLMLLLAVLAGVWSRPPKSLHSAVMVAGAVLVFALVSSGVELARETGVHAPASITVDGQPYSLQSGRILLFFFHPQCFHCLEAAKRMAQFHWREARVVAVPVDQAQYGPEFLTETGLHAGLSGDFETLKKVFGYKGYPSAVALENGREKASLIKFEDSEPQATLKQLRFVE